MAVVFNEARYKFVIQAKTGPVGRDMAKKGRRMQSIARAITTNERHVRSGRYRSSIGAVLLNEGFGLVLKFGSRVPHARLLEDGSPPHIIRARNKRALWWDMPNDRGWAVQPDSGRPVPSVNHPGNAPYQILHRAMRRAMKGAIIV